MSRHPANHTPSLFSKPHPPPNTHTQIASTQRPFPMCACFIWTHHKALVTPVFIGLQATFKLIPGCLIDLRICYFQPILWAQNVITFLSPMCSHTHCDVMDISTLNHTVSLLEHIKWYHGYAIRCTLGEISVVCKLYKALLYVIVNHLIGNSRRIK